MKTLIWVECEVVPYRHEVALLSGPARPASKEGSEAWEEDLKSFLAKEFWALFKKFERIEVIEGAVVEGEESEGFKCLVRYVHPCTLDMTRKKNFQRVCLTSGEKPD